MKKDSLGDRMKCNYENRSKTSLVRRIPVILRLDGKSFHTFTKGFDKPYDKILMNTMQETMKYLCENIQGCKLGYTQSDEITLLITDYDKLDTDAWFDYEVQKMCSISSSISTMIFNDIFGIKVNEAYNYSTSEIGCNKLNLTLEEFDRKFDNYFYKINKAMFDSRCFNIPKEEVCNCFIWRQQDATRNAIESLGQANFSHKELHKKSCNNIQDMLMLEKGINFNDELTEFKRGSCCYKKDMEWTIDKEIPIFTQDREFIEKWI